MPEIAGGRPVFRGTRYSVERVLKLVGAGWTIEQIADEYPGLEAAHVQAAAGFAAELMRDENVCRDWAGAGGLRLLCDANVGSIIARAVAMAGHDVARAIYVVPNAPEEQVLRFAVAEERVLITCDHDFGDLIFFKGHRAPPAVIYILFEPEDVRQIVPRLIPLLEIDDLRDHMTVLDTRQIRRRPSPKRNNDHG